MLSDCPIPGAEGVGVPEGTGSLGVLVLGEALGESEAEDGGLPFRPFAQAGSVYERIIRKDGYNRSQLVTYNTVPTRPPKNYLEGAPYEQEAIEWGRQFVRDVISRFKPRCILALGNVALRAATGMAGDYQSINYLAGYILPSVYGIPVVGSYHPSFLRRGAMPLLPVVQHDLRTAVAVAAERPGTVMSFRSPVLGRTFDLPTLRVSDPYNPPISSGYSLHPTESEAWEFLRQCESSAGLLAYDIETPRSASSTEEDTDELEGQSIISIQFSLRRGTGIFFPWREPFIEVSRHILATNLDKVGANNWRFDDPLLRANGCVINGKIHDVRWAWHHLQPELPANLQQIGRWYGWPYPWKHLHHSQEEAYGCIDVDVLHWIMGDHNASSN